MLKMCQDGFDYLLQEKHVLLKLQEETLEGWKVTRKIEGKSPVNFNVPKVPIGGSKKVKVSFS
jgi:hypothetical protein